MKITAGRRRDFSAYLRWGRRSSWHPFVPPFERGTVSALQAFVDFDSTGKCGQPSQPRVLRAVLQGKGALNLQIKEWAAGVAEFGNIHLWELQDDYPQEPAWVWKAVLGQADALRGAKWGLTAAQYTNLRSRLTGPRMLKSA